MIARKPSPISRCLLIHWPSSDWETLKPLIESEDLPNLNALVQRGLMGDLTSLSPPVPAIQSTSLATGQRADKHGILSSQTIDPLSGEIVPVGSSQRQVPALWNLCSRAEIPSLWIHWPNAHPAEPILGVNVSELFASSFAPANVPWSIPEQSVSPSSLEQELSELRIHFGELSSNELAPLLPNVSDWEQLQDDRVGPLADAVALSASIHAIATELMEKQSWTLAAIHYPGLERIAQLFPDAHTPNNSVWYEGVLRNFYRWHDMMLGRLLQIAGDQTMIMLVSERGHVLPNNPNAYAQFGAILMAGPNIHQDDLLHGAHTLDIVPTILAALGLPVGADMPGKVLQQAFTSPIEVATIESWENIPDPFKSTQDPSKVNNPTASTESNDETDKALQELIALGYQEFIPEESNAAVRLNLQQQYHLAQVQLEAGDFRAAAQSYEELCLKNPENPWLKLYWAHCLMHSGQKQRSREILEALLELPTPSSIAHFLLGLLASQENNTLEALEHLRKASEEHDQWPELHRRIGWLLTRLGKHQQAKSAFLKSLQLDPKLASSHLGLASVYMHEARYEEAIEYALTALQSQYFWPNAHALLGIILARSKRYQDAERAFLVSNAQRSNHLAHTWLAILYKDILQNEEKRQYHQQQADALLKRRPESLAPEADSNA